MGYSGNHRLPSTKATYVRGGPHFDKKSSNNKRGRTIKKFRHDKRSIVKTMKLTKKTESMDYNIMQLY